MHRLLPLLPLCVACTSSADLPTFDVQASSSDVSFEGQANYRACDGAPCTYIDFTLRRDSTYAADTTAVVTVDGGEPLMPPLQPYAGTSGGHYSLTVAGWIEHLQLDATAGSETLSVSVTREITTPEEAQISIPDKIVLGSRPPLRWAGQSRPYTFDVLYGTQVPALSFGFAAVLKPDEGTFDFPSNDSRFSAVGAHTVGLNRSISYESSAGDASTFTWISEFQKKVMVVEAPNL